MFDIQFLRSSRSGSWKRPLNKSSSFFKDMHSREDMMKVKNKRAVKSRNETIKKKKEK